MLEHRPEVLKEWLKGQHVAHDVRIKALRFDIKNSEEIPLTVRLPEAVSNKSVPVTCPRGIKPGQEFIMDNKLAGSICHAAWNNFNPYALALYYGASFPWSSDPDALELCCPDPLRVFVYELRRLTDKDHLHYTDVSFRRQEGMKMMLHDKTREAAMAELEEWIKKSGIPYNLIIRVIAQKGSCPMGHKVGDKWGVVDNIPEGICILGSHGLWPTVLTLRYGGSYTWEREPGTVILDCPEVDNRVCFEVRRLPK